MLDPQDIKYMLEKNLFDLNELKRELTSKVNIYKGFFTNFPKNLDMQEKILRNELRLTIVELNCELMSLEYQIRDNQSELLTHNN
jgi:hypothetical protein